MCIYSFHKLHISILKYRQLKDFHIMVDFAPAREPECLTTKLMYLDLGDQAMTKQQVRVIE